MKTNEIEKILEKYYQGETSSQEDDFLINFFQKGRNIPPGLEKYQREFEALSDLRSFTLENQSVLPAILGEINVKQNSVWQKTPLLRVAAVVLFFILSGALISTFWAMHQQSDNLIAIRSQVNALTEEIILLKLEKPRATDRLRALQLSKNMEMTPRLMDAFVDAVNHDNNDNVRLTALYRLAPFADNEALRLKLLNSLPGQTSHIIQVELINLMVEMQEKKIMDVLRQMLKGNPDKSIQSKIQNSLTKLQI